MFFQKFDILLNKQARPLTNFNNEVTKLSSSDEITRNDGINQICTLHIKYKEQA
jgi:hypothetical protein